MPRRDENKTAVGSGVHVKERKRGYGVGGGAIAVPSSRPQVHKFPRKRLEEGSTVSASSTSFDDSAASPTDSSRTSLTDGSLDSSYATVASGHISHERRHRKRPRTRKSSGKLVDAVDSRVLHRRRLSRRSQKPEHTKITLLVMESSRENRSHVSRFPVTHYSHSRSDRCTPTSRKKDKRVVVEDNKETVIPVKKSPPPEGPSIRLNQSQHGIRERGAASAVFVAGTGDDDKTGKDVASLQNDNSTRSSQSRSSDEEKPVKVSLPDVSAVKVKSVEVKQTELGESVLNESVLSSTLPQATSTPISSRAASSDNSVHPIAGESFNMLAKVYRHFIDLSPTVLSRTQSEPVLHDASVTTNNGLRPGKTGKTPPKPSEPSLAAQLQESVSRLLSPAQPQKSTTTTTAMTRTEEKSLSCIIDATGPEPVVHDTGNATHHVRSVKLGMLANGRPLNVSVEVTVLTNERELKMEPLFYNLHGKTVWHRNNVHLRRVHKDKDAPENGRL